MRYWRACQLLGFIPDGHARGVMARIQKINIPERNS
jgi:hypothetical protein